MDPVIHFEMPYIDRERMIEFYTKVFGWRMQALGENVGNYVLATTTETDKDGMVKKPGTINGGFFPKPDDPTTHHITRIVIQVDNLQAHVQRVEAAGGKILEPPREVPGVGRSAVFLDPEGNRVSMLQPNGA